MAFDFHKNLSEKVAALKESTPTTRRAVYEAARQNLLAHVRAAAPGIPVLTVIAHQRDLETAILTIENEARRHDPPPPPPERKPRPPKTPPAEKKSEGPAVEAAPQKPKSEPAPTAVAEPAPVVEEKEVPVPEASAEETES